MDPTHQPVLSITDIAALFRVSNSQAYVYVSQPGFPPPLFGYRRNRKWPTTAVLDYINDPRHLRSTPLPPLPSRPSGRMTSGTPPSRCAHPEGRAVRPNRRPIEPPPKILKALTTGARRESVVRINEVSLIPPGGTRKYWRVKTHFGGVTFDAKTGATPGHAYAAYLDATQWLASQRAGYAGGPENEAVPLVEFIDSYIARRGPDGKWGERSQRDRTNDFKPLRDAADRRKVLCRDLNAALLREFVATAGTANRGRTLINVTGTMLRFGRHAGYFTRDQADAIDGIRWVPPEGYVQQASRRDQAKAQVDIATGGNVLTHQQVAAWAEACQKRWTHGAALIHASALLGTRSGETRVLTASRDVADAGWGNYVALDRGEVLIRHQAGTGNGPKLGLPKNSKIRDIIIPTAAPAGFNIWDWLPDRVEQALAEQDTVRPAGP